MDSWVSSQSLEYLNLNNNLLRDMSDFQNNCLPSLINLDVSHNFIKSISGISSLTKLKIFTANDNNIDNLESM